MEKYLFEMVLEGWDIHIPALEASQYSHFVLIYFTKNGYRIPAQLLFPEIKFMTDNDWKLIFNQVRENYENHILNTSQKVNKG